MNSSSIERDIETFIEKVRSKTSLKIVIFGPNNDGSKVYKKRCEIREMLKSLGHEVIFCEEILTTQILTTSGLNLSVAEILIIEKCDYVICLMESPGVIGEVHDFAKNKEIAHKMIICIDRQHQDGYSAQSVLRIFQGYNGLVDWFRTPEDLDQCHLAGRIKEQIKRVAETKQYELSIGKTS